MTAACSLDWNVRSDPGDASSPLPEAALDAPIETDAADGAAVDAPDGAACAALAAEVKRTRAKAKACTTIGTLCTGTVNDECDCPVSVRVATSTENTDYTNAVAALVAACGRPATCVTCPSFPAANLRSCLQNGAITECYPY